MSRSSSAALAHRDAPPALMRPRVTTTNLTRLRSGALLTLCPLLHPSVWGPFLAYPFFLPLLLVPPAVIASTSWSLRQRRQRAQQGARELAAWAERHLSPDHELLREARELARAGEAARRVSDVVQLEAWLAYLGERAGRA